MGASRLLSLPNGARATLDHFEIPVAGLDRMAEFLHQVFGWRAVSDEVPAGKRYRRLEASGAGAPTSASMRVGLLDQAGAVLERAVPVVRLKGEDPVS